MANEELLKCVTLEAAADLSTKQYFGVVIDSSGQAALAGAGATNKIIGILQDKPDAVGRAGSVGIYGKSKAVLGGTVASGAKVTTDANGKFVTAAAGDFVCGICAKGGAANEVGEIFLVPGGELD